MARGLKGKGRKREKKKRGGEEEEIKALFPSGE